MPHQAVRIDRLQMRSHRGLAVGRDPGGAEAAILARAKAQRALAGLLEDKAVVDDTAFAPAPGRRVLVVDARPDGIDGGEVVAMRRFDAEDHLTAVWVEAVPQVAKPRRRLAGIGGRSPSGRARRPGGRGTRLLRLGHFPRPAPLRARVRAPR